jgi:hypothetical protein
MEALFQVTNVMVKSDYSLIFCTLSFQRQPVFEKGSYTVQKTFPFQPLGMHHFPTNIFRYIFKTATFVDTHMNIPMAHMQQMEGIFLVTTPTRHCCAACKFQVHFNCNRTANNK